MGVCPDDAQTKRSEARNTLLAQQPRAGQILLLAIILGSATVNCSVKLIMGQTGKSVLLCVSS